MTRLLFALTIVLLLSVSPVLAEPPAPGPIEDPDALLIDLYTSLSVLTGNASSPVTGNAPNVTIIYPLANDTPKLNVTFSHTAAEADCTVYVDGQEIGDREDAAGGEEQVLTFTRPFAEKRYKFLVNCTNGTWSASATRNVTVSNQTPLYGLTIKPGEVRPLENVTINASMVAQSVVNITITDPEGGVVILVQELETDRRMRVSYQVPQDAPLGRYVVQAYALDEDGEAVTSTVKNGSFTVKDRNASIRIEGVRRNITQGVAFTVRGAEFVPREPVELQLTHLGKTTTNTTDADRDGNFTFLFPKSLAPGLYLLTASQLEGAIAAELEFGINPKAANASENATRNVTKPQNTTQNTTVPPPLDDYEPADDFTDPEDTLDAGQDTTVGTGTDDPAGPYLPDPQPLEPPVLEAPSETGGWFWWAMSGLTLVFILTLLGYLVYNGTIDLSRFGIDLPGKQEPFQQHTFAPPRSEPTQDDEIKAFIRSERAKGFDDLTIRGALVAKGWDKHEVDRVFDRMYQEQQGP